MGQGRQAILERLAEMAKGGEKKHDILQGFIDDRSEASDKESMNEDAVLAETMIPFVAGSD